MIDATQSTAPPAIDRLKFGSAVEPPPPDFVMPEGMIGWVCTPMQNGSISPSGHVWNTLVCEGFKAECWAPQAVYETEARAWVEFNRKFAHQARGYTRCYFLKMPRAVQIELFPPPPDWPADMQWYEQPIRNNGKWYVTARVAFA